MRRFHMPARYLHDLISGAEMDLTVKTYPTFDRLKEYCYGSRHRCLTCTHVFGFSDPRALDLRKTRPGVSVDQIIRDVKEDARSAASTFLTKTSRATTSRCRLRTTRSDPRVRELLRFEADRAWQLYAEGAELLDLVDADSRGTLWLLVHTYNALLARIESLDFAVFGERVRLSKADKMIFIARAKFGRHTGIMSSKNVIVIGGGLAGWRPASRWLTLGFAYGSLNSGPTSAAAQLPMLCRMAST